MPATPSPQPPPLLLLTSINSSSSSNSNTISIIIRTVRRIPIMGRRLVADSTAEVDTITAVAMAAGNRSRTDKGLLPQLLLLAVV